MTRIIVEGLDGVGKSSVAHYLSDMLRMKYNKVAKGTISGVSEEERTQAIVREMSDSLGNWRGILDRGYLSTVATGIVYDESLRPDEIWQPSNLIPDIGVLVTSSVGEIKRRSERPLTAQDSRVLDSGRFSYAQDWLVDQAKSREMYVVHNENLNKDGLKLVVEQLLIAMDWVGEI